MKGKMRFAELTAKEKLNESEYQEIEWLLEIDDRGSLLEKGYYEISPLFYACNRGNIRLTEILLRYGFDPFEKQPNPLRTPYDTAQSSQIHDLIDLRGDEPVQKRVIKPSSASVEFLGHIRNYGRSNFCDDFPLTVNTPFADNIHGNNALHLACIRGDQEFAGWLMNCGADVNRKNKLGQKPMDFLIKAFEAEGEKDVNALVGIAKKLIENDADISHYDLDRYPVIKSFVEQRAEKDDAEYELVSDFEAWSLKGGGKANVRKSVRK